MARRTTAVALATALTILTWSACASAETKAPAGDDRGPAIGAEAPDFQLPAVAGGEVTLSELRGAPVVLIFFRGAW